MQHHVDVGRNCTKEISSLLMVAFCHLTDSHHYHHGQKPTMVGISWVTNKYERLKIRTKGQKGRKTRRQKADE